MNQVMTAASPPSPPVRVEALKGFRAYVGGIFSEINPGEVVDIERAVAAMLIASGKARWTDAPPKRIRDYLPERKRNPKADQATQISALTKAVEAMTQLVQGLVASQTQTGAKKA